jgi:hypothetical protein
LTAGVVAIVVLLAGAWPAGAQGTPKMKKYAPGGMNVSLDLPEKDWNVVSGGLESLLIVVQKRFEAAVVVERATLQVELAPESITEVFLVSETEHLREMDPSAADIKADLQELGPHRVAAFLFVRNGALGRERVLQYSMPAGKHLYRIVAVARADVFDRHLPVLQAIAASVVPSGS